MFKHWFAEKILRTLKMIGWTETFTRTIGKLTLRTGVWDILVLAASKSEKKCKLHRLYIAIWATLTNYNLEPFPLQSIWIGVSFCQASLSSGKVGILTFGKMKHKQTHTPAPLSLSVHKRRVVFQICFAGKKRPTVLRQLGVFLYL